VSDLFVNLKFKFEHISKLLAYFKMSEDKKVDLLDYLVILVKWKKTLLIISVITAIVSYLSIYFLIDEQFDSSATIIPVEENSISGVAGFLKNLPIDIGETSGFSNSEMDMYNTIIYSRTVLEKVIKKFNLINVYELDRSDPEYMEKALKILTDNVSAEVTEDNAYEISVRANTPNNAALITNYLIKLLNERIIELKTSKSSQNRIFLEGRLKEVRLNLKKAEDSLLAYQNKSGMLDAEDQVKGILEAYSKLETELITKQIQLSILRKVMSPDSPKLKSLEVEVEQFEEKMLELKNNGQPNSVLLSMNSLPKKAINYLRLLREVEINNSILEFVMPLYEQAKFDEQKDIPVLQIVDYAVPPVKKSYPPRLIFTLIITFGVFIITFLYIIIKENENLQASNKIIYIKNNLFKWKQE